MTGAAPSPRPGPGAGTARDEREGTAAGIYGLIVGAAVMTASHASTAVATVVVVLVTLTVYWAAERYARILAERIHEGQHPGWPAVRTQLTSGWEMITTSLVPLGVLLVAKLAGGTLRNAIIAGLVCATVLLGAAGWRIGRGGRLSPLEQAVSAAVAAMFGVVMIVLKAALH